MKWVSRERPKIDRIACPWLVARFIDDSPEFLYVPGGDVMKLAADHEILRHGMVLYDALYAWCADASLRKLSRLLGMG